MVCMPVCKVYEQDIFMVNPYLTQFFKYGIFTPRISGIDQDGPFISDYERVIILRYRYDIYRKIHSNPFRIHSNPTFSL
jgi:hypothetical protein